MTQARIYSRITHLKIKNMLISLLLDSVQGVRASVCMRMRGCMLIRLCVADLTTARHQIYFSLPLLLTLKKKQKKKKTQKQL